MTNDDVQLISLLFEEFWIMFNSFLPEEYRISTPLLSAKHASLFNKCIMDFINKTSHWVS